MSRHKSPLGTISDLNSTSVRRVYDKISWLVALLQLNDVTTSSVDPSVGLLISITMSNVTTTAYDSDCLLLAEGEGDMNPEDGSDVAIDSIVLDILFWF